MLVDEQVDQLDDADFQTGDRAIEVHLGFRITRLLNIFIRIQGTSIPETNSDYKTHIYIMQISRVKIAQGVLNGDIVRRMVPAGFEPTNF